MFQPTSTKNSKIQSYSFLCTIYIVDNYKYFDDIWYEFVRKRLKKSKLPFTFFLWRKLNYDSSLNEPFITERVTMLRYYRHISCLDNIRFFSRITKIILLLSTPTRPQKATPIWKPIILTRRGYDIRSESNSPCNEVKETIAWLTGIRISHLHWYSMNNSFLEFPQASSLLKFDATIDMYCLKRSTLLPLIFDTLKSLRICMISYPIQL